MEHAPVFCNCVSMTYFNLKLSESNWCNVSNMLLKLKKWINGLQNVVKNNQIMIKPKIDFCLQNWRSISYAKQSVKKQFWMKKLRYIELRLWYAIDMNGTAIQTWKYWVRA